MFRIKKWYLDCVSDAGDTIILYQARIRWGLITLNYGASLIDLQNSVPVHRYTLCPGNQPQAKKQVIQWNCPNLKITGTWTDCSPQIKQTLFKGPQGQIRWNCIAPDSAAHVRIGGSNIEGRGYVECLSLTIRPWQLPFSELNWGRFHAATNSLIWIRWLGSTARTWVWMDGIEQKHARVLTDRIEGLGDGVVLDLQNTRTLRSGLPSKTTLKSFSVLARLIPGWRTAEETKWLARGCLRERGRADCGWAIHEVVRWP
jgi:hypothetical protein